MAGAGKDRIVIEIIKEGVLFTLTIDQALFTTLSNDEAKTEDFARQIYRNFLDGKVKGKIGGITDFFEGLVQKGCIVTEEQPAEPITQECNAASTDSAAASTGSAATAAAAAGSADTSYNWSPDAVRCLIQEYIDRKDIMTDSTKPKIKEFIKIANEIHKKYPPLEGKGLVVQRKWRKLVNACSNAKKKSEDTGQDAVVYFEFYEEMREALAGDRVHDPDVRLNGGFDYFEEVNPDYADDIQPEDDKENKENEAPAPKVRRVEVPLQQQPTAQEAPQAARPAAQPVQRAPAPARGQGVQRAQGARPRAVQGQVAVQGGQGGPAAQGGQAGEAGMAARVPQEGQDQKGGARTLRRSAVDALRGLHTSIDTANDRLNESNIIQQDRNNIMRDLLQTFMRQGQGGVNQN